MSPFRILVVGAHSDVPYLLREIQGLAGCTLAGIVTAERGGEGIAKFADEHDVELVRTDSVNRSDTVESIRDLDVDLGVCLGWYEVIDPTVLDVPDEGFVGIHAAPLPRGRGQAPVNWQLILGYEEASASVFGYTEGVDAGPVYAQPTVPILEGETIDSLYDRLMYFGIEELQDAIQRIARGSAGPTEQDASEATYWPERRPEDGLIDWSRTAEEIDRFVRALVDPYPGAFTYIDGEPVEIAQAEVRCSSSNCVPGEVVSVVPPEDLIIATGGDDLSIRRVNRQRSPALTGSEFAAVQGIDEGDQLGSDDDFPLGYRYTGLRGPGGRGDLRLETNVAVGEPAENYGYCYVPGDEAEIEIRAEFAGITVMDEVRTIDGHECVSLSVRSDEPGPHLLRVQFDGGEERMSYVYVTESGH